MDEKDKLQIKIDEARAKLPENTRLAIDSVDLKDVMFEIQKLGKYDFIQLGELEMETELLLCGLINPAEYQKDLAESMKIDESAAREVVKLMNEKVFRKIRDKMIELTTGKEEAAAPEISRASVGEGLKKAGVEITNGAVKETIDADIESREEILKRLEMPEIEPPHPIVAQKLSGPMQMPSSTTIHSFDNLSKPAQAAAGEPAKPAPAAPKKYEVDPYREIPE